MDWVFQSNPTMYDLVKELQKRSHDSNWAMNQHRARVTPGDRVFFWRSGPDAAVVAVGQVTSPVYDRGDESKFGRYAVDVAYEGLLEPPLMRAEIKADPILAGVKVFTRAQGTNFMLTEPQAKALEALTLPRSRQTTETVAAQPAALDPMRNITEALRQARRESVQQIRRFLANMDPYAFEWLVAAVLVRSGYSEVEVTLKSGDKGIDVRATMLAGGFAPLRIFVQAKRSPSVGRPTVQKLRGSCPSGFSAMLVASGDFSDEATEEAADRTKHNSVTLVTGAQFAELMLDHGIGAERKQLETHTLSLEDITEAYLRSIVQVPDSDGS